MKHLLIISIVLLSLNLKSAKAQENKKFGKLTVKYEPTNQVENEFDTVYTIKYYIDLAEVNNLYRIYTSIGSKKNDDDVFSYIFYYGQSEGLPEGITYELKNDTLVLGLGNFPLKDYYYRVSIENKQGKIKKVFWKQFNDIE